ncbi:MAG: hypothetical protein PF961_06130 [Planctomycetota bacterium]|jgi:hypothetical protein|nr:hypothetical protein [Planctomycetota bacterium]
MRWSCGGCGLMAWTLPLEAGDAFAVTLDGLIRRGGGAGNCGQLRVHCGQDPDRQLVSERVARLHAACPLLSARLAGGLRGPRWWVPQQAAAPVWSGADAADSADAHMAQLDPSRGRNLCWSIEGRELILTWHHALCDARGAMALLTGLEQLGLDAWWQRSVTGCAQSAAERGRQARRAVDLLRPHRARRLWQAPGAGAWAPEPMQRCHVSLGGEGDAILAAGRRLVGRLAETPFLLACLAAALEDCTGVGGDFLFPLAVDLRTPAAPAPIANAHGFAFVAVDAGLATLSVESAARALKAQMRAWARADGERVLLASLSWFPRLPQALVRRELGLGGPGIAASCLVANTGLSRVPDRLAGATVTGIDHLLMVPARPGLAVLFRRDGRGLGFDVMASAAVHQQLPVSRVAAALQARLRACCETG